MKMDLRYSQLQKCLNLFNPGMPAAPLRLLRVGIEPDKKRKKKKRGTLITAFLGQILQRITVGGRPSKASK